VGDQRLNFLVRRYFRLDRYARRDGNFVLVVRFVPRTSGYQGLSPWLVRTR
jgi:hypothetical protein